MIYECRATNCKIPINATALMCDMHWRMLPWAIKKRVWDTYRHGQEKDFKPSRDYLAAARAAVIFIAKEEGHRPDTRTYDQLMGD